MELGSLQKVAVDTVNKNVEVHRRIQREAAETAQAVAELAEAMSARRNVYMGIAAIAVKHSIDQAGQSVPIPVARVEVPTADNTTVERNVHAIVRNQYRHTTLGVDEGTDVAADIKPESIRIDYMLEAEAGDVERGIIRDAAEFGRTRADDEKSVLSGCYINHETFELGRAPTEEGSTMFLYDGKNHDKQGAKRQLAVVTGELPSMRSTLELLQAGVKLLQPAMAE